MNASLPISTVAISRRGRSSSVDDAAIDEPIRARELLAIDPAQREQRDLGARAERRDRARRSPRAGSRRESSRRHHDALAVVRPGTSRRTSSPAPGVVSTQIRPPCASTYAFASVRPRPVPPNARVDDESTWKNGSKILRDLLARDADARVGDDELERRGRASRLAGRERPGADRDADAAAIRRELHRVRDQARHDLPDLLAVAERRRCRRVASSWIAIPRRPACGWNVATSLATRSASDSAARSSASWPGLERGRRRAPR